METSKTLVIKSNKLIGMQTQLSLVQMKIFALLVSKALDNPEVLNYKFSAKELMNSCNITDSNYTALQQTTASMIKPVIFKGKNEKNQEQYPLLDGVIYNNWMVDITIHRKVKPFILDIATKYTKYYFENISFLNSTYSIRLYELLKEFEFRWWRDFEIEEFRFLLNIKEGTYSRPYDLKTKIIQKAQRELKEKTDISFSYIERKEWRKLVWLSFSINSNNQTVLIDNKNSLFTILKTKILLNDNQIKTVLKQFDEEYIKRNIEYTLSQKNIKNIPWYFQKALKDDYGQSLFLHQENIQKENLEKQKSNTIEEQKIKKIHKEESELKEKVKNLIIDREDEIIKILPDFIEINQFILTRLWIDTDDTQRLIDFIKWDDTSVKWVQSMFIWFAGKRYF